MASTPLAARSADSARRFDAVGEAIPLEPGRLEPWREPPATPSSRPLAAVSEPDWRYERKFVADGATAQAVSLVVRLHPAAFRVPFPQRHINNIYLDSPGLACFYAHVNGTRERFKLRIRWYGAESGLVAQPVLEVKRKTGAVGTKERYPLEPFEFGPRFRFDALRRAIQARVSSSAIASLLGDVEPSLFNRYRRSYFLSADGRFRLTVDSELGFRPLGPLRVAAQRGHAAGGAIIVELKSDVGDDASRIVQRLPYRLSKYSKYVQGIGRLYGLEI